MRAPVEGAAPRRSGSLPASRTGRAVQRRRRPRRQLASSPSQARPGRPGPLRRPPRSAGATKSRPAEPGGRHAQRELAAPNSYSRAVTAAVSGVLAQRQRHRPQHDGQRRHAERHGLGRRGRSAACARPARRHGRPTAPRRVAGRWHRRCRTAAAPGYARRSRRDQLAAHAHARASSQRQHALARRRARC